MSKITFQGIAPIRLIMKGEYSLTMGIYATQKNECEYSGEGDCSHEHLSLSSVDDRAMYMCQFHLFRYSNGNGITQYAIQLEDTNDITSSTPRCSGCGNHCVSTFDLYAFNLTGYCTACKA